MRPVRTSTSSLLASPIVLDEWTSEIDASFARAVLDRLDAIAGLGDERRARGPDPHGGPEAPWTAAAPVEERLAAEINRLLHLEGSVARIVHEARQISAGGGDARRIWAVALLLGSATGEAAAEAAASTLCHPGILQHLAAREALSLGCNEALGRAVMALSESSPPPVCASALQVLRFRRDVALAPCAVLLGHHEPSVVAAAARGLAAVPERRAAALLLGRVLGDDPDEQVAVAAAESLVALGDPAGLAFVRGELEAESTAPALSDEARVAFVRLLALAGDASDLELFFRSLEPSPRDAVAVGWYGHPDLVEWLIGSLDTANEVRRSGPKSRASAPSLLAPAAFETAATQAMVRIAGPADGVHPGSVDAAAWRAFWARARGRLSPGRKHRFGRLFTPEITLEELRGESSPSVRADAALELAIVTGGAIHVETGDWISRQSAALAAAAAWLAAEPRWVPGAYPAWRPRAAVDPLAGARG